MTADEVSDVVETIHRRNHLLTHLCEESLDKPAICDRLDVSRSTVDRAVRDLEAYDLVRRDENGYAATAYGRLLLSAHTRLHETAADVRAARSLFEHWSAAEEGACALPLDVVEDATVYPVSSPTPFRPAQKIADLLEGATHLEGVAGATLDGRPTTLVCDAVRDGALTYECVYSPEMAEYLRTERAAERREMAATGRYRAFELDEAGPPFELFVLETTERSLAVVLSYAGESLRGALVNDDPDAVAWARECLDRYRAAATEMTADFDPGA